MDQELFFPLVLLCTATHGIRSLYEILKHKKIIKSTTVTFVFMFANMALLWASWFALCSIDLYRINIPAIIRYGGILLCVSGLVLFLAALGTIKTLENYEGDLITKGIYSKIRHPMYLGFIFWLMGFPIFSGSFFSIFLSVPFMANVLFWRQLEEKELEERFSSYRGYKKTTVF